MKKKKDVSPAGCMLAIIVILIWTIHWIKNFGDSLKQIGFFPTLILFLFCSVFFSFIAYIFGIIFAPILNIFLYILFGLIAILFPNIKKKIEQKKSIQKPIEEKPTEQKLVEQEPTEQLAAEQKPQPAKQTSDEEKYNLQLIESIPTSVVGVTFASHKDDWTDRQDLIEQFVSRKTKIHLEFYEFEGKPACYVVLDENDFDIGNLRKELSKDLVTKAKYRNCIFKARITGRTGGTDEKPTYGCNIVVDVYKKNKIVNNLTSTKQEEN